MNGEHAIVIGASMAGLLAARALAESHERVTVIDRDALPAADAPRRAVPQGRHVHTFLPRGQACVEALLPGLGAELVAAGAPTYRAMEEMRFELGGRRLARASLGISAVVASRPFIEGHVRRRVRDLANVRLLDRCDVLGLCASPGGERVSGVRILRQADGSSAETLAADLVVCATGRGARVPAWLTALGFPAPAEERLKLDIGYASRHLRLPPGALEGDKLVLIGPRPDLPRSLFLFAQERGGWILTLAGYGAEHRPPADPDALEAFTAAVAPPDVREALRAAVPLDDVATHRFPASVRRRYDRLPRFPGGLLVCGDALCAFNPVYGQGMAVAAAEAVALRDCRGAGDRDLARRFFAAVREPVDHAWTLATGADLALPGVAGPRPLRVRAVNAYLRRLRAVAQRDPEVAGAFIAVVGMREPPSHVLRPATMRRVLRGPRPADWEPEAGGVRRRPLQVGYVDTVVREAGPAGAREAVVFVHGNPGPSAEWGPLLAATGTRLRAVAFDQPGFGRAAGAFGFSQSVAAHSAFLGRALDELGIERVHLVAHDFGGPWGLHWAAHHPDRLASAVLIGTGVLPGYRWHALARIWRTPGAGELFMRTTTRAGFRLLMRRGQAVPLPRAFVDHMYDNFGPRTRASVLELYRSVADVTAAAEQFAAALRPYDRPALVLWGRRDPYLGAGLAEAQRRAFPRAEVRVLDHCGHWPHVDEPETVAAAVGEFLSRHAAPARPAALAA
jgi:pimeloyl-ACP methyl ester carboxylesterase/2-polyprenyl-6-methoxyphenol hydroxylase-like FAD-dependent oxidoreductase